MEFAFVLLLTNEEQYAANRDDNGKKSSKSIGSAVGWIWFMETVCGVIVVVAHGNSVQ